jgi:ferritin
MSIEGYVDYKRREYCNDIQCPIQQLLNQEQENTPKYEQIRDICKTDCIHSTYEFHHWLIQKGYLLVRPK